MKDLKKIFNLSEFWKKILIFKDRFVMLFSQKARQKDSDQDGLSDWDEIHVFGTDPRNPDTDGDGMPDGDEVAAGRNPNGSGYLKDLFIPHAGNDFQPAALHTKRIIFHAASVIAVKAVVVVFAVFFPLSAWLTPDIAAEQSRKIIQLTNDLREKLKLSALIENRILNQAAYAKVEDMFLHQYFAHVSQDNRGLNYWLSQVKYKYAVAGENLAMGFSSPEDVVEAWKKSPTHFANLTDKDFTEIGVAMVPGSFEGVETDLVAQYFGSPQDTMLELARVKPSAAKTVASSEKKSALPSKRTISPVISQEKTRVILEKTPDEKTQVAKVEAYLATSTQKAEVILDNNKIALQPDQSEPNKWAGEAVVYGEKSAPAVPITIMATDTAGSTVISDISQANVLPKKVSTFDQYLFYKNNPSRSMALIFNISSIYFKIVLLLAIIAILLSVFNQIRKQHLRAIIPGLGLVVLLVFLIAF